MSFTGKKNCSIYVNSVLATIFITYSTDKFKNYHHKKQHLLDQFSVDYYLMMKHGKILIRPSVHPGLIS